MATEGFHQRPPRPQAYLHENINFCFRTAARPSRVLEVLRAAYLDAGAPWSYVRTGDYWESRFGSYGYRLYIVAIPGEYIVAISLVDGSNSSEFARSFKEHLTALKAAQTEIALPEDERQRQNEDDVGFGSLTAREVAQYVPEMRGLIPEEIVEADAAAEAPLPERESRGRVRRRRWFG